MNIREIAQLAGVSISTVSKVLNRKDQAISEETRRKVLAVMKENHYQPYVVSRFYGSSHSFLIGAVLCKRPGIERFLETLMEAAAQQGYSVLARFAQSPEEEKEALEVLRGYPLDGLVLCRGMEFEEEPDLESLGVPTCVLQLTRGKTSLYPGIDLEQTGWKAAQALAERKHRNFFCVVHGDSQEEKTFVEGVQKYLSQSRPSLPLPFVCRYEKMGLPTNLLLENTAALCYDTDLAEKVYEEALRKNRRIPKYLSVLSLEWGRAQGFLPKLATVGLPFETMAEKACQEVVRKIENPSAPAVDWSPAEFSLQEGESLGLPLSEQGQKVVVVGSINMDTTIALSDFPRVGQTSISNSRVISPGGKGLNQAVAVAKLEGTAVLIGKVGKDYEGSKVWDHLQQNRVSVEYVRRTSRDSTGNAYICVQQDGESGIMVYKGANAMLTSEELIESKDAFDRAEYCLLSTELDNEAIETAAQLAWEREVKIVIKPAALDRIRDELLERTFIFLPNSKESARLCPGESQVEQQAEAFLKRGAKHVIVTLGHEGCYWTDGKNSQRFPAADFETVDTTGAADAFAAALVVCLTKGLDMREAIHRATVAAGFSTTKWRVTDAMIDWDTLEFLCSAKNTLRQFRR